MFNFDIFSDEDLARKLYTVWKTEMGLDSIHSWDELKDSPHKQEVDTWLRLASFVKSGF